MSWFLTSIEDRVREAEVARLRSRLAEATALLREWEEDRGERCIWCGARFSLKPDHNEGCRLAAFLASGEAP